MTTATIAPVRRLPAGPVAGAAYAAAWVAGLSAFPAGPAVGAADAEVIAFVTDHRLSTALQSTVVHGVAAIALAAVLFLAAKATPLPRWAWLAGMVGVALSFAQLGLGLGRSAMADGSVITTLGAAIDRVDGLKMLAFAGLIGLATRGLRRCGVLGRRMSALGVAATGALVASAPGYLALADVRVAIAAPALVLLVAWVVGLGAVVGRRP